MVSADNYLGWKTERFSPAFKNIVHIHIEKEYPRLEHFAAQYDRLEKKLPEVLPEIWSVLHKRFKTVMGDADPDSYLSPLPKITTDEEIKHLVTLGVQKGRRSRGRGAAPNLM
ncbi:MAG: hypothetical protein IPM98_21690 [Lewinellaceae bacterium]|nr:hypothetical protein [Lewinellaceae bacterium]